MFGLRRKAEMSFEKLMLGRGREKKKKGRPTIGSFLILSNKEGEGGEVRSGG